MPIAHKLTETLLPAQMRAVSSEHRYTAFVGGRGSGKTHAAAIIIGKELVEQRNVIATAQTYRVMRFVIFAAVEATLSRWGVAHECNSTLMTIKVGRATCYFFSAEGSNEDTIRGVTDVTDLVMDEGALATEKFFTLCAACCRGTAPDGSRIEPRFFFFSTPRGSRNWLSQLALKRGKYSGLDTLYVKAKTSDNDFNSEAFAETLANIYTGKFAEQELGGEIVDDSGDDSLFSSAEIELAMTRKPYGGSHSPLYVGVDCARFGDDRTVIAFRQGPDAGIVKAIRHADSFAIASAVEDALKMFPDKLSDGNYVVRMDGTGGFSSGAADILRKAGRRVDEINFGASASDDHYSNKRTEMYFGLRLAVRQGLAIIGEDELADELAAQRYEIAGTRAALVPKDKIKAVLGRSPDLADALALTALGCVDIFSEPSESGMAASIEAERLLSSFDAEN